MSATKHGIACHCSKCHRFNALHGEAKNVVDQMLEAATLGKDQEVEDLHNKLKELNSQIFKLGDELNR